MNDKTRELELVEELRQGSLEAFHELVEHYTEKAYHLALRITRNKEDAEEIVQDVFVTVHHKINRFEGKSAFSSWLYRITVNAAFMKLRKRKQHQAISFEELGASSHENMVSNRSDACDVNYMSSRHELQEALQTAIVRLPEEYRTIFVLRDIDGLSNQEVGQMLNISVPAVKSRLHRSRLMLRKRLTKFYEDYCEVICAPVNLGYIAEPATVR